MKLTTALERVKNGHNIKRSSWEDTSFVKLNDNILVIYRPHDMLYHSWIISREDLFANDWVLC